MLRFDSLYLDSAPRPGRVLDVFPPLLSPAPNGCPALFFVHGGGWQAGGRAVYHQIIHAFCQEGFACATTDYRLTGGTILSQIEDVRDSLRAFLTELRARGLPEQVILAGCSAGAHLALMAALEGGAGETSYLSSIAGVAVQAAPVTFEPWPDIFPPIAAAMEKAVGEPYSGAPERYRAVSPIRFVKAGMPRIFFLHAEHEHMFPLDQLETFRKRAGALGTEVSIKTYPRTEHGFFYSLDRWQQREAREDIRDFALAATAGNPFVPAVYPRNGV